MWGKDSKLEISSFPIALQASAKKIILVIETVKDALVEITGVSGLQSDMLWKRGGHPLVPARAIYWEARNKLEVSFMVDYG